MGRSELELTSESLSQNVTEVSLRMKAIILGRKSPSLITPSAPLSFNEFLKILQRERKTSKLHTILYPKWGTNRGLMRST